MTGVDTNVLVRYFAADDEPQVQRVDRFLKASRLASEPVKARRRPRLASAQAMGSGLSRSTRCRNPPLPHRHQLPLHRHPLNVSRSPTRYARGWWAL